MEKSAFFVYLYTLVYTKFFLSKIGLFGRMDINQKHGVLVFVSDGWLVRI
jgi:hypothetical protein